MNPLVIAGIYFIQRKYRAWRGESQRRGIKFPPQFLVPGRSAESDAGVAYDTMATAGERFNAPAGTSEENLINYTGRGISTTNALSKTQCTAYTLRGQVAATLGE